MTGSPYLMRQNLAVAIHTRKTPDVDQFAGTDTEGIPFTSPVQRAMRGSSRCCSTRAPILTWKTAGAGPR